MNEIDVASAYTVANAIAALGAVGGLYGLYHLQVKVEQKASIRHIVPLFCCTAILGLLAIGQWYSGPVDAVTIRMAIVLLAIAIEVAIVNPLRLVRRVRGGGHV